MEGYDLEKLIAEKSVISVEEVAELYLVNPGVWVILEIMEADEKGRATRLRPLKYAPDKEILREYMVDHDEWGEVGKMIYFFTGHDGTCERIN